MCVTYGDLLPCARLVEARLARCKGGSGISSILLLRHALVDIGRDCSSLGRHRSSLRRDCSSLGSVHIASCCASETGVLALGVSRIW